MIPALLSRDPALRSLPKWLVVGTLISSVIAGVRLLLTTMRGTNAPITPNFGDYLLLALALWIPVALFLAFGNAGQRCNRFDLALPISANRLNAAHFTSVLLSGSIVLAAAAGVVLFHDWIGGRLPGMPLEPQPGVGELIFFAVTALALVAASLLSVQPSVYRTPSGRGRFLFVMTHLLGGLGLILALNALPLAVSLLPLAVAAILMVRSFRALPSALTLIPLSATEEQSHGAQESWATIKRPLPASEMGPRQRGLRSLRLDATLYKILALGIASVQMLRVPVNLISAPFLAGMGLVLSGFAFDNPIRLTNITLTAYMALAFLAAPLAQLHLLDPLPITRRRIFALLMLPGLLAVAAGYGAGRLGVAISEERPAILFTAGPTRNYAPMSRTSGPTLRVPPKLFRVARDGAAPLNESPWGESHEAWQIPVYEGSRGVAYSPFSTTEESSVDFVALQISRAVEAIYGRTIPYEEIRERYLETSPDGEVRLRNAAGLTLLADYPELHAAGEGPVFPVVLMLTGLLYLAFGACYFRAYRASVSERARKLVFFGLLGAALALHLAQFVVFMAGLVEDWVVLGLVEAGIHRLAVFLPGGAAAVWVLCASVFAVAYRLTQRAFAKIEAPLPQCRPQA